MKSKEEVISALHRESCQTGQDTYVDPETGYQVFTELYHLKRGSCCQSGCRHCPWKKLKQKSKNEKPS